MGFLFVVVLLDDVHTPFKTLSSVGKSKVEDWRKREEIKNWSLGREDGKVD